MATRFTNGLVYLGAGKWAGELFVDGDKVVDSSTFEKSLEQEEIDLQGNTLVPAFRDGHAHPLFAGRELSGLNITRAKSIEEIQNLLAAHAIKYPDGWITGGAYDRILSPSNARAVLDEVVRDRPVVLHADDHHTIWVNTKALEVSGLLKPNLPKLKVGRIDIDESSVPTGILREFEAINLILQHQPESSLESDVKALLLADQLLLAAGIVEVQDAWIDPGMAEVYLGASDQLRLDYKLLLRTEPGQLIRNLEYIKSVIQLDYTSTKISIQGVKFFLDGVFGSATAAVKEPYLSTQATGDLNWNFDELVETISKVHELGLQSHLHAIGDAGIEFALAALQQAKPGALPAVVAHAELTSAELIKKAKELSVHLVVQPYWAQNNSMLKSCLQHLGEVRTEALYSFRDILDAGVELAFSSDWPVSRYQPIEGITVAVYRKSEDSQTAHNPSQAIRLEEALDAYTSSVSKMLGEEGTSLEPGANFDAVILEGDLKQKDLDSLMQTKVLAVYKSGTKLLPHH